MPRRWIRPPRTVTETGLSLGTPAYMSPEQASVSITWISEAIIYALGCVLYEMLAGQPPFAGGYLAGDSGSPRAGPRSPASEASGRPWRKGSTAPSPGVVGESAGRSVRHGAGSSGRRSRRAQRPVRGIGECPLVSRAALPVGSRFSAVSRSRPLVSRGFSSFAGLPARRPAPIPDWWQSSPSAWPMPTRASGTSAKA